MKNNYHTPYNRLFGQQMLSGTQIISTSHGITGRNFFHVFLPFYLLFGFKFMSDLLHYKWKICIPNMTVQVLIFSKFSVNEDRIWHFQLRILQNINVFSKISKESTSFYHIHEKYMYSVSSTFLYNGNSKCYVVRILYAIAFQWSKCFGYRGQQIILKLTITDSRCWKSGTTVTWILISGFSCNKLSH
jgi:hypothetical protein